MASGNASSVAADALGASIELGGSRHTVVGVAPANFTGVQLEAVDVWLALTHSARVVLVHRREPAVFVERRMVIDHRADSRSVHYGAGCRGGRCHRQAAVRDTRRARDGTSTAGQFATRTAREDGRMALWLAGGALLVLLIACANVAVLVALRAFERRLEIAIRIQLGATARRVFLRLFVENLALALLCIGSAVLIAMWVDTAIRGFFPTLPDARINVRSLKIVAGFACLPVLPAASFRPCRLPDPTRRCCCAAAIR